MADDDVGAALAGPFDKFLSPYDKMRRRTDIDDRSNDPEYQHLLSLQDLADNDKAWTEWKNTPPDAGYLGIKAGLNDIGRPPSKEEMMDWLMQNEATGPDPLVRVPVTKGRSRGRR